MLQYNTVHKISKISFANNQCSASRHAGCTRHDVRGQSPKDSFVNRASVGHASGRSETQGNICVSVCLRAIVLKLRKPVTSLIGKGKHQDRTQVAFTMVTLGAGAQILYDFL